MKGIKQIILSSLIFWVSLPLTLAQNQEKVQMADKFRADGKIYVVLVIILIILSGLFYYLFRIDRKVSKMEDQKSN